MIILTNVQENGGSQKRKHLELDLWGWNHLGKRSRSKGLEIKISRPNLLNWRKKRKTNGKHTSKELRKDVSRGKRKNGMNILQRRCTRKSSIDLKEGRNGINFLVSANDSNRQVYRHTDQGGQRYQPNDCTLGHFFFYISILPMDTNNRLQYSKCMCYMTLLFQK